MLKSLVPQKKYIKELVFSSLLISAQNFVSLCLNLTDNIMVTFYSETALVGISIVNNYQYFFQMIIISLGEGIIFFVSRSFGKKDLLCIQKFFSFGICLTTILGVIFNFLLFTFPHFMLSFFTKDLLVISESIEYAQIISFTYVLFAISQVYTYIFRGIGKAYVGWIASVFSLTMNVIFNYMLIYGNFGCPEMGIKGSAIATLIARISELLIIIFYAVRFKHSKLINVLTFKQFNRNIFSSYMKISSPILVSNVLWGLFTFVQAYILGTFGVITIAANSIAMTLYNLIVVISCGSASATSILVGQTIGRGNFKQLKMQLNVFQLLFISNGIISGLLCFCSKEIIFKIFHVSAETQNMSVQFIFIMSVVAFCASYQLPLLMGIIRGMGNVKYILKLDIVIIWLVIIPLALFSKFILNLSPLFLFLLLKSDQLIKWFIAFYKVNYALPKEN